MGGRAEELGAVKPPLAVLQPRFEQIGADIRAALDLRKVLGADTEVPLPTLLAVVQNGLDFGRVGKALQHRHQPSVQVRGQEMHASPFW